MSLAPISNCRDFQKRFDLFLDGEMDGRAMRSFAMHVTRCPECEEELRHSERVQESLAEAVQAGVEQIEVSELWRSVERELAAPTLSFWQRLRERREFRTGSGPRTVAWVASAAAAVLVLALLWSIPRESGPLQVADNKAHIDALSSSGPAVAVWTEPGQNTTAIWVTSYEP